MSSRKRKQRPEFNTSRGRSKPSNLLIQDDEEYDEDHKLDASLSIQAYEADIIREPRAAHAAASLEVFDYEAGTTVKIGNALIQWGEDRHGKPPAFPGDEDELIGSSKQAVNSQNDEKNTVWVDRYVVSCVSTPRRSLLLNFMVICYGTFE